ncbi:MAG: signal peptidase I [Lachnospiraceae bacterium]|nr:signal peptidase I [Lachnospiraceae bacterium]
MKQRIPKMASIPSAEAVAAERERLRYQKRFRHTMMTIVYILIVAAAVSILAATTLLPVLQVSGTSMEPTLEDGDVIVLLKSGNYRTGDLCAFYYQNKLLLKRVIGVPGDVIDMDTDGNVSVNGEALDEPYVTNLSLGECDLTFPYQVPENRYFVMGDNRSTSIDSRSSVIGCIEKDQIVGKAVLCVWPTGRWGIF